MRRNLIIGILLVNGVFWGILGSYHLLTRPDSRLAALVFYAIGLLSLWRALVSLFTPAPQPAADSLPESTPSPRRRHWELWPARSQARPLRRRLIALALLFNSLGWCLLGQYYLSNLPEYKIDAAIFYTIGLLSFWRVLATLGVFTAPPARANNVSFEPVSQAWPLLFVSAGLALVAYIALADNTFTRSGVLAWLGAIVFFLAAMWPADHSWQLRLPAFNFLSADKPSSNGTLTTNGTLVIHIKWRTLALLAILLLAAFFRLHQLDQAPPDMTSDHIEKLLDIYDLAQGERPIYFERNTGREPFQFYWAFTVMRVLNTGLTFYGLKLANALIGILAVYGIYLLGRELAGAEVGLLAAFFAAVMQWAESITRMGLRFPYVTIAAAFALWALLRALRTGRRVDYLLAGLIFGAGFHGYTAYRIMPLVVVIIVIIKLLFERPRSRAAWAQLALNLASFACIAFLVFLPLARYWHDQPDMFWFRSATRIQGEYGYTANNILATLANNTLRAVGMFNIVGDSVWANTIPGKPTLDEVGGVFFIFGVMAAFYSLLSSKAGRQRNFPILLAILAGFILLFPSILSLAFPNENPSVVRTAGAIPVVAILVGLGLCAVTRNLWRLAGPTVAVPVLIVVLAITTIINYQRYFEGYVNSYKLSSQNSSEMALAMRGFMSTGGNLQHVVIRAWPYWVDTRALALIFGDPSWQDTNVVIDQIQDLLKLQDDPASQMYILHPDDLNGLVLLQTTFPSGYATRYKSTTPRHDFILFHVPSRTLQLIQ